MKADIIAAAASAVLPLAAAQAPSTSGDSLPEWFPYVVSALGPVVTLILARVTRAGAVMLRGLARWHRQKAQHLLSDGDPTNDEEATKHELRAALLESGSEALDAARLPERIEK